MNRFNKFLALLLIFVMVLSFVPAMAFADGEDTEGDGENQPTGFTVSFDPTSGSGKMEPVTGVSGEYILPECGFTAPENCAFKGWTLSDGTPVSGSITVTEDTVLCADWRLLMTWAGLQSLMSESGAVILENDVVCDDQQLGALVVPEEAEVTLDLNGHCVDRGLTAAEAAVNGNVISVFGKLTVTDSAEGGMVTGGNCAVPGNPEPEQEIFNCGGIYIAKDAQLVLEGGTISGNTGKGTAAAGVRAEGAFILSGGVISGNKDDNNREINLYLCTGALITIGTDDKAPQSGTLVGISTETAPALDAPVTVAEEGLSDAYADFFASDDPMFKTVIDGGKLLLALNSFRVSFDVQGQGTAPEAQTVYAGEKAAEPEAPEAEGYLFKGWFKDRACTNAWDFESDTVAADIILYAKWADAEHTVSFDMQGHGSAIEAVKVNDGEKLTAPEAPTETGWRFDGWYKEAGCENAWSFENDTVTADTTLYAKWIENTHTVSFDMQGHGSAIEAVKVNDGEKLTAPAAPAETGWRFDGWYKEAGCTNAWNFENDTVTADIILYAKWADTEHTVSFDMQGHGSAIEAVKVNDGEKLTAPETPTATGWRFDGWYKESGCRNAWDFGNDTVTADVTLYAKWTDNTHTVSFNMQGHGSAIEAVKVNDGEKLTAPAAPAETGWRFDGWHKEAGCRNAWDFANDTVTADVTLYAKWTDNTHTVSFNMQGHGSAIEAVKVNDGEKVTEPAAPAEVGATFVGWYREAGCRNAWDFENDTVTADITLYAKWNDLYTIIQGAHGAWIRGTAGGLLFKSDASFDKFIGVKVDGQYIAADNYIAREGSTAVLLRPEYLTTLSYGRHSLAIVSLDGSAYTDFIISETTKCTVSFDVQGIGAAPVAQTVSAGSRVSAPAAPYASGYMFKGWFTDKACTAGNAFDFSAPVYADTVLYAKWIKTSRVSAAISGSRYAEFTSADSALLGAGESYTFSIRVTDSNYYVGRVTVDGVVVSGMRRSGANAYYTFTNNDASKSHIVRFVLYNSKGVPATGDSFKPLLWCTLLAASAAGIAAAVVIYKRKKK